MSDEPITLEFIGRTMLAMQVEMREMRREMTDLRQEMGEYRREMRDFRREVGDVRSLTLLTVDQVRRTDRHVVELRDELELIIKAEVMGRIGIFESGVEKQMGELRDRVEELETGKSRFTP